MDDGCVATETSGRRKEQEFSSSLAKKKIAGSFLYIPPGQSTSWSSHDQHVSEITMDTASDVSCVASMFLQAPPACMSLRAANGSPIQTTRSVLGHVTWQITLLIIIDDAISRSVDALIIPFLGPDQLLLDNATMARFGAVLDRKRQRLKCMPSKTSIPSCSPPLSNVAKTVHMLRKASAARVNRRLRRYYLIVRLLPNVFALACLPLSSI